MPKYIELEQAINLFYPEDPENDGSDGCTTVLKSGNYTSAEIESMLSNLPVADVAPVVHGKWELRHEGYGHYWECSVCHTNPCIYVTRNTKFCPNCGAKMDLEE